MSSQDTRVLDQMVIVHLDFDIWSGQKTMAPDDIKLGDNGELPPGDLAKPGRKNICDPTDLKIFQSYRTETTAYLAHIGMRFLNGYAIPEARRKEVDQKLHEVRRKFTQARADFLAAYPQKVADWAAKYPGWEEIVQRAALSVGDVEKRLDMNWDMFGISASQGGTGNVESKAAQLGGSLLEEVVEEARHALVKHIDIQKSTISTHLMNSLEKLIDRVNGLSFLDSRFANLVTMMREAHKQFRMSPSGKKYSPKGDGFFCVYAVVSILADVDQIDAYVNGTQGIDSMATDLKANAYGTAVVAAHHPASASTAPASTGESSNVAPAANDSDDMLGDDLLDGLDDLFSTLTGAPVDDATTVAESTSKPASAVGGWF